MLTVHHLNHSRSQRILWMLEELALPYRVERYQRNSKTMQAPPELRAVHPLGKSPVLVDEADGRTTTLVETGAIVEYLVEKSGGRLGPPPDRASLLRYRQFLHYAEGSLMPPLFVNLVLGRVPLLGRAAQKRIRPMIDVHLDFVEAELSAREWFAGDRLSAADIMMSFPLEAAHARGLLGASAVATRNWLSRIQARPAYRAALQQGGPYAYARG